MKNKNTIPKIRSRAQDSMEPARGKGFSYLQVYGDKMGTVVKYINYTPAQIYDKGKKWFVWYLYRSPEGAMQRFKVYEDLNRIKDLKAKKEHAELIQTAVNYLLSTGFNPFTPPPELEPVKTWTVIQAINFFKQKLPDLGLRPKTIESYSSFIELFSQSLKPFWNKHISEFQRLQALNLLSKLKTERKWGNSMYNNGISFGRLMFSFFIQNGIYSNNPFKEIKALPETKTQNQPFSDEHWELIQKESDPQLKRFMLFMYHTGTRPNEVRQLKYEHILRDRKLLLVPGKLSKGRKDGYIAISDRFLELFPEGTGFIFGTAKNNMTTKFTNLKRRLNLPEDYTLYSVKHTRVVHMALDKVDPYTIMQFLRHTSIEVTMEYLRGLGLLVLREAAEKVR